MEEVINQQEMWHKLSEGFSMLFDVARWDFIAYFILIASVFTLYITKRQIQLIKSGKKVKKNWIDKIPKGTKVFTLGSILAIIYCWSFGIGVKDGIFSLMISIAFAMVIHDVAVRIFIEKITGLKKLEEEKENLLKGGTNRPPKPPGPPGDDGD